MNATIVKTRKPKKKLKEIPPIERFIESTKEAALIKDQWSRFVLPYPPSVNRTYGLGVINGRAMMFLTSEAKRFKNLVEQICLATAQRPLAGRVHLTVDLYRERKAGDADPLKLLFDSLQQFAYHDDKQICGYVVNMHDDPSFPRVVVGIKLADGETLEFFK